jgi:hypothetical protein
LQESGLFGEHMWVDNGSGEMVYYAGLGETDTCSIRCA